MNTKLAFATLCLTATFSGAAPEASASASLEQCSTSWYPATMCYTPHGSCVLVSPAPAGAFCTCYSPFGASYGRAG